MSYTANITSARFRARSFYIVAEAYRHLRNGTVTILLGPTGRISVTGMLRPCNEGRQGFVACPDLYNQTSPPLPLLPLQLGDQIEYETTNGAIRILSILRRGGSSSGTSSGSPRAPRTSRKTKSPISKSAPLPPTTGTTGLPPYLAQNTTRIRNLGTQTLDPWNAPHDGRTEPVMKRLYRRFPGRTIQRADLVTLYRSWRDPELALVATMVWGGIKVGNLKSLLAHGPKTLVNRMNDLRKLIRAGQLAQAFIDCSRGERAKFNGVDVAFFTKIFFFLGQAAPSVQIKPLILDKWTTNAFCLCFLQLGGRSAASQHFRLPSRRKFGETEVIPLRSTVRLQTATYLEYVNRMNAWATALSVPPDQLEQFVFGQSRKRKVNRRATNPRNEIIDLIDLLLPLP